MRRRDGNKTNFALNLCGGYKRRRKIERKSSKCTLKKWIIAEFYKLFTVCKSCKNIIVYNVVYNVIYNASICKSPIYPRRGYGLPRQKNCGYNSREFGGVVRSFGKSESLSGECTEKARPGNTYPRAEI